MRVRRWVVLFGLGLEGGCRMINPAFLDASASDSETDGTGDGSHGSSSGGTEASQDAGPGEPESEAEAGDGTGVDPETGTTGSPESTGEPTSSDDGPLACQSSPPAVGECPEGCTCDDGVCEIRCEGEDACESSTIACPDGWPCRVVCEGVDACKASLVQCPAEHACELRCEQTTACADVTITCEAGLCTVACDGAADDICSNLTMECGAADSVVACEQPESNRPMAVGGQGCSCSVDGCG